jgi:hypothetical protein
LLSVKLPEKIIPYDMDGSRQSTDFKISTFKLTFKVPVFMNDVTVLIAKHAELI